MSHLWNSLITRLWPSPPGAIGLGFGRDSLIAVRTVTEGDGYRITCVVEEPLPFSFSSSVPGKEDCAILSQAMQRVAVSIPQTYWPLQIALPDPQAMFEVMEFDSLPETAQERAAIAQFRLGKQFPAMTQMQCATQVISKKGEPNLLLAIFIQRAWLDCVEMACRTAGFVPSVIDTAISHVFNRFHDVLETSSGDGVLISVESDAWTILFLDEVCRPRFVRSRWREMSVGKDVERDVMVKDIERLIISYVSRAPGRRIGGVYLSANDEDRSSLTARLDGRMQTPCVQLDLTQKFSVAPEFSLRSTPPGVLAAAVPRL